MSKFERMRTLGSASQALIGAPKYDDRTIAWVFVDIGGGAGALTNAEAEKRLFGMNTSPADKSLKQYYLEASYGRQDITGSVVAPLSYSMSSCDTRGMTTALRRRCRPFDHYLYCTTRTSACSWSGLASVGRSRHALPRHWYNGSSSCVVLCRNPGTTSACSTRRRGVVRERSSRTPRKLLRTASYGIASIRWAAAVIT